MSIELKILDLIQILHTPFLDRLMCFVTKLGNAGAIWILAAAILLLIPKTRKTGAVKRGEIRKQAKTLISSRCKDSGQTGYK